MNERKRIREGKGEDDIFVWETPEKMKGKERKGKEREKRKKERG